MSIFPTMNDSMLCKAQAVASPPPLVSSGGNRGFQNMETYFRGGLNYKDKVIFVVGATGTGKTRLAVDIATRFPAEIINSDKMQLYEGLDIATNKVTDEERKGVPHHLLGVIKNPDTDFSASEFSKLANASIDSVLSRDRLPIVAGGSNSFIENLVDGTTTFRVRRECCFLWVDVEAIVLREFVYDRVDKMVESGLVDEVRGEFLPYLDYTKGIRKAIGVPELDGLFRAETRGVGESERKRLLATAVSAIKENTWRLAIRQVHKIKRLQNKWEWSSDCRFHRIDATKAFEKRRRGSFCPEQADEAWRKLVASQGIAFVDDFMSSFATTIPVAVAR